MIKHLVNEYGIFGAIILCIGICIGILNKLGWIHLGKMNGKCSDCKDLNAMVTEIKDKQIINIEAHKSHVKELEKGEKHFECIDKKMTNLKIGMVALLERSGGVPQSFKLEE